MTVVDFRDDGMPLQALAARPGFQRAEDQCAETAEQEDDAGNRRCLKGEGAESRDREHEKDRKRQALIVDEQAENFRGISRRRLS